MNKRRKKWLEDVTLIQERLIAVGITADPVVLDPEEARALRNALGIAGNIRRNILPPLSEKDVRHQQVQAIFKRHEEQAAIATWGRNDRWRS